MKKSILLIAALTFGASLIQAQNPNFQPFKNKTVTINTARSAAAGMRNDYILNEKGVDKLILNEKFIEELDPEGLYDKIEPIKDDKNGNTVYRLMKRGKDFGRVAVKDGIVVGCIITSRFVHLENDVRIGMPIIDILKRGDCKANLVFDPADKSIRIEIEHEGIGIIDATLKDLNKKGYEKVEELQNLVANTRYKDGEPMPSIPLSVDDFNPDFHISGFRIGDIR